MTDITETVAETYRSLRSVFDDLNRIGRDCSQALREEGLELTDFQEYSHSPNSLTLKKSHAWFFSRATEVGEDDTAKQILFFSCFVYFEADQRQWKVGKPGSPELWFFLGTVSPPPQVKWASQIQTFFNREEQKHYSSPPHLGGGSVDYQYKGTDSEWKVVILGHELAAIDSPASLKEKAVKPLVTAGRRAGVL
jgi:hypothetical protein